MEGGDRSQQTGTTRRVMHVPDSKVRGPCTHLPHLDREESKTVEWGHTSSLLCFFKSYLIKKTLFTESRRCQASRPRCRHGRPSEADAQADVSEVFKHQVSGMSWWVLRPKDRGWKAPFQAPLFC